MNNNREAFEAWAVTHGGLDLTMHEAMDNEKLPFMCTYYSYTTEIAWRAFANKKCWYKQSYHKLTKCNEKSQAQQEPEKYVQCGVRVDNGHCLGGIWNCSSMQSQTEEVRELEQQLDVAAEFCRQYQIEIARLKVDLYSEKEKNRVQFENSKLNMENIKNLLNEAYEDNSAKQRVIEELKYEIDGMTDENQTQKVLNNHLQFLLDSVMLEFCPNEMTEEQMENWKKSQKKIDTSDPLYYKSDTYKNNVKFSVDMIK